MSQEYFEEYPESVADPRAEFFTAFSEEDHRILSHALWVRSEDMRGAYRTAKYYGEYINDPMIKAYSKAAKTAQRFWLVARAAYCKKYGHMPT